MLSLFCSYVAFLWHWALLATSSSSIPGLPSLLVILPASGCSVRKPLLGKLCSWWTELKGWNLTDLGSILSLYLSE